MCFANKNALGGTLLTTFSFNWVMNYFVLDAAAHGRVVDASVVACVDLAFVVIFAVLTYAVAEHRALLVLMLDIDALYALRIARHFAPTSAALGAAIGVATFALAAISATIALSALVTPQDRAARSESKPSRPLEA